MSITRLVGVGGAVWNASYLRELEKLGEAILNRKGKKKLKKFLAVNSIDAAVALLHAAISDFFERDVLTESEASELYHRLKASPACMATWRQERQREEADAAVTAAWERIGDDFEIVRFH